MTNEELEKWMEKFDKKLDRLTEIVMPLVTDIALVKQDQRNDKKEITKSRIYWAIISSLVTFLISALTYIYKLT